MINRRIRPKSSRLSVEHRRCILEAIGIKSCSEADWTRLEYFISAYRLNKGQRRLDVQSRGKMNRVAQLVKSLLQELHGLTDDELMFLFATKLTRARAPNQVSIQKLVELTIKDWVLFLRDCEDLGAAARFNASHYDETKRPHNVDIAKYEFWAFAGRFFYEVVAGRRMGTSRGPKDGEYGRVVGGPFVRFIQSLMQCVDGSEPKGHAVQTFYRHYRSDESRGKSVTRSGILKGEKLMAFVNDRRTVVITPAGRAKTP